MAMIEMFVENKWEDGLEYTDFITKESDNGNIFHLGRFFAYHDKTFFDRVRKQKLLFYKKNKIIAVLIGIISEEQAFISPYGASYGGFVISPEMAFKDHEQIFDLTLNYFKNENISSIKITNTTLIHSKHSISEYYDYLFLSNGFNVQKSDMLLVHKTSIDEENLIARFHRKTATELKQPLKAGNLTLSISGGTDLESYMLLSSSQHRLGSTPTHSLSQLESLEELLPGTIKTFKVFHENTLVAGIITFKISASILNTFYIFDSLDARQLKANHFAYYHVLKWASNNGFEYVDFGPSTFGYIPNRPLIMFKEKFDAFPVLRKTYFKNH